jgi:anaerobic magnesium-protoporphyrin IX monomethyl ester cyclase
MNKVLLFNPRAANHKPRLPNSILQVAASIEELYDYVMVDGNVEQDPGQKIFDYLGTGEFGFFCLSVMPGPQLKQAIPLSRQVKAQYPAIKIIWGGYFASNQSSVVLDSGYVDYIVYGPGDKTFPQLLNQLQQQLPIDCNNLIYKKDGKIVRTPKDELYDQDELRELPYQKLNSFYPIKKYLGRTYLGRNTIAYHSSVGCPFKCAFCGIVPIYNARWKGKSADKIYSDIKFLKDEYGGDSIEFHDNNFFVSEKRTVEFSNLIKKENMVWWGEGRIDTIDKYSDASLAAMREAGCRMIFYGAETGNDAILKKMDKGGTQTGAQIRQFAARMSRFDIIPEYSFVLGTPAATEEEVMRQIEEDIAFIREIKSINPQTEIIIYVYSPVPTEGSELFNSVKAQGFKFPSTLEEWIAPEWENFDLRKNPLTPWLKPYMIDHIRNFETVLNGYYPTVSDVKLSSFKKSAIRAISALRYRMKVYDFPYEIKALQKFWLRYRQPEWEGF